MIQGSLEAKRRRSPESDTHGLRGVCKLLITVSLGHKLHNNFAVAGVVMNVLRVYASNFAEKNADNHDKLKNEKYAPVVWGVLKKKKRKVKGPLPSYFHLNTQLCLQPSVSGVLLQHTFTLQKSK